MNSFSILEKAKNTKYKHHSWFLEGTKSVYDAVKYFVDSGDFSLGLKASVKYHSQVDGLKGLENRSEILEHCIKNVDTHWKHLAIKYSGGGQDSGKLKIQSFIAYKSVDDLETFIVGQLK